MFTSAAFLTVLGVILGGAGTKVIELLFGRKKVTEDIAAALRKELRDDIVRYRSAAQEAEKELDTLQERYYEVLEANAQLKSALSIANYKVNAIGNVVDQAHPEAHLKKEVLELPE